MALALYMDVHIPGSVTRGLRLRQVDVLTAQEDGADALADSELLNRASALGRVLFTYDRHLLAEAARRQRLGVAFAGVIYARPSHVPAGVSIRDLEFMAKALDPEDMHGRVQYLPF